MFGRKMFISSIFWRIIVVNIILLLTPSLRAKPLSRKDNSCAGVENIVELLKRFHGKQFCEELLYPPSERVSTVTSTVESDITRSRGITTSTVQSFTQRLATTTFYTKVPTQTVTKSKFTATKTYTLPRPITTDPEPEKRDERSSEHVLKPFLIIKDPIGFPLAPPYFNRVVNRVADYEADLDRRNHLFRRETNHRPNVPPMLQPWALSTISSACSCLHLSTPDPISTKTNFVTSTSISLQPTKTILRTTTVHGQTATLGLHAYRGSTTTTETLNPTIRYIEPLPATLINADCPYFFDGTGGGIDPYAYEANGASDGLGLGNRVEIFYEDVYTAQTCCRSCFQVKNCVASANLIGTCQLLINDVDTNADGTTDEVKTGRCPLGVENYPFGARGQQGGYAYPGPCGY